MKTTDSMGLSLCFLTPAHLFLLFSIFNLTVAQFTSPMPPLCHDNERSALLQFKESLYIFKYASSDLSAYPKIASWKQEEENSDCCSWDGITCNKITGHVIRLDLASSCLYGSINSSSTLFHLVHLEWLSLADNYFNLSLIPSRVMNLSRLSHLNLSHSFFSGQIPPELLELSKLVSLDLSFNSFHLKLQKPGLKYLTQKLSNLKILYLSQVNISSSVPQSLANSSSLIYLSLSESRLQREFPSKLFKLPNLRFLDLMSNPDLTGYLPVFEKDNPLQVLILEGTNFYGKIPASIENLQSLNLLDISSCSFSGTVPPSLGNLTTLVYLSLSKNKFAGELPSSIGNLGSLEILAINYCNFSGKVPPSLGNLIQLIALDLSLNTFGLNSHSLSWIANLTNLSILNLSGIKLAGEIPYGLMNLTQLTALGMSCNQLNGSIPRWLMNLNQLSNLGLRSNQLTGHIPSEIGNLTQLTSLSLGSNRIEGMIPSSIFELKNLQSLDLSFNNLRGTVDLDMFLLRFRSLEMLSLSSNNLSLLTKTTLNANKQKFFVIGFRSCNITNFPDFLRNQDQLMGLDLSSNTIAGQIPGWFLNVSIGSLEYLNLSNNLLTGFDQHSVLPWTILRTLDLSYNRLQGPLPVPWSMSIHSYLVSKNQLIGKISPSICTLNGLYALDLSYNNLSGMLPKCLGNFSDQLSILKLQGNIFSGNIPLIFENGTKLRMIDLSYNLLQGRIPRSLANCTMLEFLNLGSNHITDVFPSWLGSLPELKVLILKMNRFHGVINEPKTDFGFQELHIIDLSHNRFAGNLPSKYFKSWNAMKVVNDSRLTYMKADLTPTISYAALTSYGNSDYSLTLSNKGTEMNYWKLSNLVTAVILSNNEFSGEVPTSIGNLIGLQNLNISNNKLQGHIPSSLANVTMLESLDLSNNKLSGEIPPQLAELTYLEVFDVSYNHLTGPIPRGKQFGTFDNTSYIGDSELCGEPLSKRCENSEGLQKEDEGSSSPFAFGWKIVVIGYATGLLFGLFLGHIVTNWKHKWFAKTLSWQFKTVDRKRRCRNKM